MADLIQPIMPTESTIGLQAIMRGFEGLAQNRRYAQNVQLQLQQMAQQAKLQDEAHKLRQQEIDNQWQVQQEQIKNYQSMESERANKIEQLKKADASVGPMVKDLAAIPTDIRGTPEHENQLALIMDKYANTGVFDSPRGQQVWRGANLDLLRNQRQNNYTLGVLNKQYNQMFANKGLDSAVGDYLQYDPETKKFKANDIWATNPDGSVYVVAGPGAGPNNTITPGAGGPVNPNDPLLKGDNALSMQEQLAKGYRYRTFSVAAAKQALEMKQKRDNLTNRLTGSPTAASDQGTQQSDETAPAPSQFNQGAQQQQFTVGQQVRQDGKIYQFDGTNWNQVQ